MCAFQDSDRFYGDTAKNMFSHLRFWVTENLEPINSIDASKVLIKRKREEISTSLPKQWKHSGKTSCKLKAQKGIAGPLHQQAGAAGMIPVASCRFLIAGIARSGTIQLKRIKDFDRL